MPPALSNKPENFSQNVAATNRWAIQIENDLAAVKGQVKDVPNVITRVNQQNPPTQAIKIGLDMPKEFTVAGSPAGAKGDFKVDWATEVPLQVLISNTAEAGGVIDQVTTTNGDAPDPVDLDFLMNGDNEVAIMAWASNGGGAPGLISPWTNWTNNAVASLNAQFRSKAGALNFSQATGGGDFAIVGLTVGARKLPSVVQTVQNGSITSPLTNTFSNPTAAGNRILVFASIRTHVNVNSVSISDSQGRQFAGPFTVTDIIGTSCFVWLSDETTASSEAITISWSGSGIAVAFQTLELDSIQTANVKPHFDFLTSKFIPPVSLDLGDMNANGGVSGTLDHSAIAASGVTPGSYTNADITVQADGTITAASNGTTGTKVDSLNSLTGALSLTSTGSTVTITPSGSTINLETSSTGASFGRNVISSTSYSQLSSDIGKALDVQSSGACTITLAPGASTPAYGASFGFNRTSGSTTTATLPSVTLVTGRQAVITIAWYGSITDGITVADTNGNTWSKVPNTFQINPSTGTANAGQQLWTSAITNGGSGLTITATFPSTVSFPAIYGADATGVDSSSPIDQSASAHGNAIPSSGNITTTASKTWIYGSVYNDSGTASGAGSGWTDIQNMFNFYLNEYQTASSTVTVAATDNTGISAQYTAAVVAFKGTSAAPLFTGWVQNNSAFVCTVAASAGSLINGASSISLYPGQGCTILADSSNFTAELGSWHPTVKAKTTTYTAVQGDYVLGDTSSGGFTVTLPAASTVKGAVITVTKVSSDSNNLTISRAGSDLIVGATTAVISVQYNSITLLSDGSSNWYIL